MKRIQLPYLCATAIALSMLAAGLLNPLLPVERASTGNQSQTKAAEDTLQTGTGEAP